MNMFKKLPYFVILKNRKYKINVDFRAMLKYEEIVNEKKKDNNTKIREILQLFYPYFADNYNYYKLLQDADLYKEAVNKLLWFYKCGKTEQQMNYHKEVKGVSTNKQIYSYEYDDQYIWGAFWDRGIDLTKDFVHWWKFKALLVSMPEDTPFEKIKGYRAYTGDDEQLKNLKSFWELPLPSDDKKRLDKLYEVLKQKQTLA